MTARLTPDRAWWTAEEIAAAALPDLPATKRGVNLLADRLDWRSQASFARRRAGKGGGWEYSWQLFPSRAKRKLLLDVAAAVQPERPARDEAWAWYESLPASVTAKAQTRLKVIQEVEALEPSLGRHMACVSVGRLRGIGTRTIWSWFAAVEGVRLDDRLPYLAPRNRAAVRAHARQRDCDPEFFDLIKSDFLRLEAPPFTDCYRRALRVAKTRDLAILPERTMRRRLDASVSEATQILARKGVEAVKRLYPVQVRDKTALGALEAVNADFHKFDVFVRWPAGPGEAPTVIRPQMVAFQDIYSGRILAWRVDVSPNSTAVLLAAGDMINEWGIPEHVLLDNGREFAAKAITGGSSTRYRFKVKEDDIPGLFTSLGCTIHWATPYSGQSKPIERAFRDLAQTIAKDPRFAGAYTGNRVDAKPENYGSKAIDLEAFLAVVAEGIEEHNTRVGRRSDVAFDRSFAEVFDESYAARAIRKATEAQKRLWLLGAEGMRTDTNTGAVWFQGNEFWADWMGEIRGERVIIRFDPAAFWDGVHVYAADNSYLGHAPVRQKAGFFDMDEARAHARARRAWMNAERDRLDAQRRFSAMQIGQTLDDLDAAAKGAARPAPEAKVVRGTFGKPTVKAGQEGRKAVTPDVAAAEMDRARDAVVTDLTQRRAPQPTEETSRERFRRALELERAMAAGGDITPEQQRWLSVYQTSPEYGGERKVWESFGDSVFG
jgi:putative transposase